MKILMCPPDYYGVDYEINPWMNTSNNVDLAQAKRQWRQIHDTYIKLGWKVSLIEPIVGLPDIVFTANGGFCIDGKVMLPTFRQPERQPETEFFKKWFQQYLYSSVQTPVHDFEGEGDALLWRDTIFAGYPWRSDKASHSELEAFFDKKVISLQLTDARFYHLDTCLTIVNNDTVALWKNAFSEESLQKVKDIVPNILYATDNDAMSYGLNAVSDGDNIVISDKAKDLIKVYKKLGLQVHTVPISEFQKSGGGVKCLTLELRSQ